MSIKSRSNADHAAQMKNIVCANDTSEVQFFYAYSPVNQAWINFFGRPNANPATWSAGSMSPRIVATRKAAESVLGI